MTKIIKTAQIALLIVISASLSGCIKTVKNVGYNPEIDKINKLEVGSTRKAIVKRELGSPSAVSTYGKETWYYISTEKESVAFFTPKIKSQKVVAIIFDDNQTIAEIKKYDESDANDIKISKDETKTEGHDQGVLGQILGNVGRFNTDRRDAATGR
jgi:outer membrane protein assembly factor BamE (lipoprotein component of BamABCDE complex)